MLHRSILRPLLFRLSPETSHELAIHTLATTLSVKPLRELVANRFCTSPFGTLERFGLQFANPVGLAAGFDKNGIAVQGLAALGFGFIEVGTVTHHAQPGNAQPRLFRLPEDKALVNRLGFNNDGAASLVERLKVDRPACPIGINIGKSRITPIPEATADYLRVFETIVDAADYIAINVSSPNTPHLRELQHGDLMRELLDSLAERNRERARLTRGEPKPILVKVAPDLGEGELEVIIAAAQDAKLAGIIATNTTVARNDLQISTERVKQIGDGGLSGRPLRRRSTEIVRRIYRLTNGRLPIIGVGGVFTAEDAWDKISHGASLVQLYTGFIYEGVGVARRINEGLAGIVQRAGFRSLDAAIGCRAYESCNLREDDG